MGFEGEFAHYEPLRRILSSQKVTDFLAKLVVRDTSNDKKIVSQNVLTKDKLAPVADVQPDLVLSIDGSYMETPVEKGFPQANIGCVVVASVLLDLKKIHNIEREEFPNPREVQKTETTQSLEAVFPGCNVMNKDETEAKDTKAFFRKKLYEELEGYRVFSGGETLLETYEYLLDLRRKAGMGRLPKSPIDGVEEEMTIRHGKYSCPHTSEMLYSTDALRFHELMNPSGSNGDLFGQTMSVFEKLFFVNALRSFERKSGWIGILRRVAFFLDGPLAVFSTASWLTQSIEQEIKRINDIQKKINKQDMIIIGLEKSGAFFNHFEDLDTNSGGTKDCFPCESAFLLDDDYIKKNIIYSTSTKPYAQDTYFGRKFFYKTKSGQRLVPCLAFYSSEQKDIKTAKPERFPRLRDVMDLLDMLVSSRYPNSITPLISAHAEAAIPLSTGQKIFDEIARKIREQK